MSKHDAAPTHSWVIASHVNRFIVRVSLVLLVVLAGLIFHVGSRLHSDCTKPVDVPFNVFSYTAVLTVTKDPAECSESESFLPDFTHYP